MEAESTFIVFYSWQSDLPDETNRRLLREALRNASTRLESLYATDNLRVEIDEATRNLPGSPNIPQAILEKIGRADAFVADISTINATRAQGTRATPNPNVMIELGYAIANCGWSRIAMLFNTDYGTFPDDVPFDIDRHRISKYRYSPPDAKLSKKARSTVATEQKEPLFELVFEALKAIYDSRPPKPHEVDELEPEKRKRRRDVDTLATVLPTIHIPTMDEFFSDLQRGSIPHRIFLFWEGFNAVVSSSLFHLYDRAAFEMITKLHQNWGKSLNFGEHFSVSPGGRSYTFHMPGDIFQSERDEKAWKRMQELGKEARAALHDLLPHIREHYPEIDLNQTSHEAWLAYVELQRETEKRFGETNSEA